MHVDKDTSTIINIYSRIKQVSRRHSSCFQSGPSRRAFVPTAESLCCIEILYSMLAMILVFLDILQYHILTFLKLQELVWVYHLPIDYR